ncbi:hypothetical protein, partial [Escherichia coli]|uniref:hypothetical protein n=1 Tax=Escherichia coli TaxID=562 RepID=UPI001411E2BB
DKGLGGPNHVDKGVVGDNHSEEEFAYANSSEHGEDANDISSQIGRALKSFAPYFTRQIQLTMEVAVNNEIARRIKEEVSTVLKDEVISLVREE